MKRYENSKIYKLIDPDSGHIGSTYGPLLQRLCNHKVKEKILPDIKRIKRLTI